MKLTKLFLVFTLFISLIACDNKEKSSSETSTTVAETIQKETPETVDKATQIIQKTIKAHGGELYDSANYEFVFRGKTYRFKNDGNSYLYEVESTKEDETTVDVLDNGSFSRFINNKPIKLSDKKTASAIGSINSVIYFATLPHKLNDAAVNKKFV
jgi:hypothetical protein